MSQSAVFRPQEDIEKLIQILSRITASVLEACKKGAAIEIIEQYRFAEVPSNKPDEPPDQALAGIVYGIAVNCPGAKIEV